MKAQSSHGNKGRDYAKSRKMLITACSECRQRKQRCDQKQPCYHCSRRWPQPACIYINAEEVAVPSEEVDVLVPLQHEEQDNPDKPNNIETLDLLTQNIESYQRAFDSLVSCITRRLIPPAQGKDTAIKTSGAEELRKTPAPGLVKSFSSHSRFSIRPKTPSRFSITSVDPLHFLGITPTTKNGELLHGYITLISKYPFSIDGNPSPNNYYNNIFVPWAVKSPLLAYLGIFTASCYQAQAQNVPQGKCVVSLSFKAKALRLLNEMMKSQESSISDEAITGVVYLIVNEWYWSSYENVQAHMMGLKEMVRLRGGLGELGMNGFLRKMVLLCDYHISCSYATTPTFPHNINPHPSYTPSKSTPLLSSHTTFLSIASLLFLSPSTAKLLDDVRFSIHETLKQASRQPAEHEKTKLAAAISWVRDDLQILLSNMENPDNSLSKDPIYKACLLASTIYHRALSSQIPLSQACTLQDLNQLWVTMWKVPLTRWKSIPGIFLFIILAAIQSTEGRIHGTLLKTFFKNTSSYMALENWDLVDASLRNFSNLQGWLGNGGGVEEVVKERFERRGVGNEKDGGVVVVSGPKALKPFLESRKR